MAEPQPTLAEQLKSVCRTAAIQLASINSMVDLIEQQAKEIERLQWIVTATQEADAKN